MSAHASGSGAPAVSAAAWEAIQGAYDLQVHVAPDVIERRIDDLDLAREFLGRGLRGFVLKSHYVSTAERARVVTKAVPGISALGAVSLNHSVGGLNPVAVEIAGRAGAKIVWMPTVDAANETAGRLEGPGTKLPFWPKSSANWPPPASPLRRSPWWTRLGKSPRPRACASSASPGTTWCWPPGTWGARKSSRWCAPRGRWACAKCC